MARRFSKEEKPVRIRVDGKEILAREGEPVAQAIVASGRLLLGRSVKYHRPRGPACMAGNCDGCLMRVDGVPNVMTCRTKASDGLVVETQNVVGSADADLLAATDWFFPEGMNHHEMFTKWKPLNQVMQKVARRIAGIGELPSEIVLPRKIGRISCDVVVVGGGPAGLAAAAVLGERGEDVVLVDEEPTLGGHLNFAGDGVHADMDIEDVRELRDDFVERVRRAGVRVLSEHFAAGKFEDALLLHGDEGTTRVDCRRVIIATGAREGAVPVAGGDLPGVFGPRAMLRMFAHGVVPGKTLGIVGRDGWSLAVADAATKRGVTVFGPYLKGDLRSIEGRQRVRKLHVLNAGVEKECAVDTVSLASSPSAAFELAAQFGAQVSFRDDGFFVEGDAANGATQAKTVRAIGECTGVSRLEQILKQAHDAALQVSAELRHDR